MNPTPGEILSMSGEWINNVKYGKQFNVVYYKCSVPDTV